MDAVSCAVLGVAVACFALVVIGRRTWARFWFALEDPRTMGLLRIVFAMLAICNVASLHDYVLFLFSDEGILPAAVARQAVAGKALAGFGEGAGEPYGFFDLHAVARYLQGPRLSLLLFWDAPWVVWLHVVALYAALASMMVGLWSRTSAAVSLVLMASLFERNPLFWEGTEVVFRVFFVYLVFARCGHAWSVDNWRRCRRLRRQGLLGGVGAAPSEAYPEGREAVYRRIPTWPRRLMMLQLAALYLTTGALKSGQVWANGDAVYYAMSMDHFYRLPPQMLTAALGTNLLRLVTWFVRFGEIGFALVFVGAVLRVAQEQRAQEQRAQEQRAQAGGEAPSRWPRLAAAIEWTRRWVLGRRIWITWALLTMGGVFVVMNIGLFQPIMMALCLVYFRGEEVARGWARLTRRWRARPTPLEAEDPALPHLPRDAAHVPAWALWTTLVLVAGAAVLGSPSLLWSAAGILAGAAAWAATRRGPGRAASGPWAYGPLGRTLVGGVLAWHVFAVGAWLVPKREDTAALRERVRPWVRPWLRWTRTTQGWGMFAPNPPRRNVFLQAVVTDAHGESWDMQTDVYAEARRPIPFVFNDRMRKMNRRIIGGEAGRGAWYRKWYARWQCRQFALAHGGHVPLRVELIRLSYRIPSPEQTRQYGWYDPMHRLETAAERRVVHSESCADATLGQPAPEVARRYGLEAITAPHRPFVKRRLETWRARED